jgi:enterochelin esterase-like enzyme
MELFLMKKFHKAMKQLFSFCICILFLQNTNAQYKVSKGIIRQQDMQLTSIPNRPITVWKPNQFDKNKFTNVLILTDGQMLFDSEATWNKQEWKVDETIQQLIDEKKIEQTIVIAIENISRIRYAEMLPYNKGKHQDSFSVLLQEKLNDSSNHTLFTKTIATIILPQILSTEQLSKYKVYIGGSSMGGLNAWNTMRMYPKVFAGAMCMSTHWPGGDPTNKWSSEIFFHSFYDMIEKDKKSFAGKKMYFDYGTATLDAYFKILFQKQKYIVKNLMVMNIMK